MATFHPLTSHEDLNTVLQSESYAAILKHNTTCSISKGVLARLQQELPDDAVPLYILDIHQQRPLSDALVQQTGVPHQSPQLLLLRKGSCVYHDWGYSISAEAIEDAMA